MTRGLLSSLAFLALSASWAQSNVDAIVETKRFRIPGDARDQLDVNISFLGNTVIWKANERGFQQAHVEALTLIEQGDSIVDYSKTSIAGPERTDTLKGDFLHQEHFALAPGSYSITVELRDELSTEKVTSTFKAPLVIPAHDETLAFSDVLLTAASTGQGSKTPLPYSGTYYPETSKSLGFYTELYGTHHKSSPDSLLILTCQIENYETRSVKGSFKQTQRLRAADVVPVAAEFDIAQLPSGNYLMAVEAHDKNGKLLARSEQFFQRNNPMAYDMRSVTSADITGTFADLYTDPDTLADHISSMRPIAGEMERRLIDNLSNDKDMQYMKRFMYTFWYNRNGFDPETEWKAYHEQVQVANKLYGCRNRRGYATDQGYVYLKYGKPNTIMDRSNLPDSNPYMIWHYYRAGRYSDKRFIFSKTDRAGECWELLHSEVPGEIQNPHWNQELHSIQNGAWNVTGDTRVYTISGQRSEDDFLHPR